MTEAQKKATAKWNKYNMVTVGCTLRRSQADKFKAICAGKNLAANHVIKQLIYQYIAENTIDGKSSCDILAKGEDVI